MASFSDIHSLEGMDLEDLDLMSMTPNSSVLTSSQLAEYIGSPPSSNEFEQILAGLPSPPSADQLVEDFDLGLFGPDSTAHVSSSHIEMESWQQQGGGPVLENTTNLAVPAASETVFKPTMLKILGEGERQLKRFKSVFKYVQFEFVNMPGDIFPAEWLTQAFDELLSYLTRNNVLSHDWVGLDIHSEASPDRPIGISFRKFSQITPEVILNRIEAIVQSNSDFLIKGPLRINFMHTENPRGAGNHRHSQGETDADYCHGKTSIVVIENENENDNENDNLCLPRALVVGIASVEKDSDYKKIRQGEKRQSCLARELCWKANVDLPKEGGGVEEIRKFQEYLSGYTITVFIDRQGRKIMFQGPNGSESRPRKNVDLYYYKHHYNTIVSVTGAFDCGYFCRLCRIGYNTEGCHNCPNACIYCKHPPACKHQTVKHCNECNRDFVSLSCFANHLKPKYTRKRNVCNVHKICSKCQVSYNLRDRSAPHKCGEMYCSTCKAFVTEGHNCYIIRDKPKKDSGKYLFMFYDLECTQETPIENRPNMMEHVPNWCVVQQACASCINEVSAKHLCNDCGIRQHMFSGENTISEFFKFLMLPRKTFKNIILIAHNMQAYDGQFLLRYMSTELSWKPELVMKDKKILSIRVENLTFVDSLNFLPMALSKLPKAFGLPQDLSKGYFPHFFNKKENWNYEGSLPSEETYGVGSMTTDNFNVFKKWYTLNKESEYIFKFKSEIENYCAKDVTILRLACLEFRKQFILLSGIDPLREAITIAGACMKVFRRKFLKDNKTIGIIPPGGYRWADIQSKEAIVWLNWLEHQGNVIQHAGNGREKVIRRRKVDGFQEDGNIVYQYHGCYWHGCPSCYPKRTAELRNTANDTMTQRYETTVAMKKALEQEGFTVIEMWSCQFREMCQENPALRDFVAKHTSDYENPLNPRDALYGGRTNCTHLYCEADITRDEQILYYDICSLYPDINKSGKYPIDHPVIYVGDKCKELVGESNNLDRVEGVIKCTILPPCDLYHPVLPIHMHGKLMFVLCRRCAQECIKTCCPHNDSNDRVLYGTWIVDEVRKAVDKGYTLLHIQEIWHYKITQYNAKTKAGGHFVGYINCFLKLKVEASGWPSHCSTQEEMDAYIKSFEVKEGIKLDAKNIKHNPGLRSLAKIMLNSLWGKFGQRDDMKQCEVVESFDELTSYLSNPSMKVTTWFPINDDLMYVQWKHKKEGLSSSRYTNVVIAAYTTTQARLKLYEYLEKLERRVLYYDTDSVIFIQRPDQEHIPTGDYLGDMTDELAQYGPGSFIDTFVSGGPKNYAFHVKCAGSETQTTTVCKCRGITMNHGNQHIVNFQALKSMVVEEAPPITIHIPNKIVRTNDWRVASRPETKIYRPVITKRRRIEDFDTLPFGYKRKRISC